MNDSWVPRERSDAGHSRGPVAAGLAARWLQASGPLCESGSDPLQRLRPWESFPAADVQLYCTHGAGPVIFCS